MNLMAVTIAHAEDAELHHAAAPGDGSTLCGVDLAAGPSATTRFLSAPGSLCGQCVDLAFQGRFDAS